MSISIDLFIACIVVATLLCLGYDNYTLSKQNKQLKCMIRRLENRVNY